jgi:hypothetical protein
MADRVSVASAHARLDTHEAECALRYKGLHDANERLHDAVGELKDSMKWVLRLGAVTMLSLIGWLAVQVYSHTPPAQAAVESGRQ